MKRAQARFFVEAFSSKCFSAFTAFALYNNGPEKDFDDALEYIQSLLPADGFAVGAYSMADIAIAPFFGMARIFLLNGISASPNKRAASEGALVWEAITTGKFARLGKYIGDLFNRESYKATFDEVCLALGHAWVSLTSHSYRLLLLQNLGRRSVELFDHTSQPMYNELNRIMFSIGGQALCGVARLCELVSFTHCTPSKPLLGS